jgi:hypothetical protein
MAGLITGRQGSHGGFPDPDECARIRTELGVHVIGAIEPADRARVDRHLASCPRCRDELAMLAGLPGLLHRVAADPAMTAWIDQASEPPGPPVEALITRLRRTRARRRRLAVLAAALLAAVAGATGWQASRIQAAGPSGGAAPRWAVTTTGSSPAAGAWAAVRYAAEPWGTELEVQVSGIPAGTRCSLLVTGTRGQDVTAGGWTIAAASQHAWYPASAPFGPASLRGFEVIADGKPLVHVPAR